ncbi:MAG: hypothetical protein GTO41_28270 [Burkholderiales bacterium]|nr:hypothetical protein [Burkholderiales bacterium]
MKPQDMQCSGGGVAEQHRVTQPFFLCDVTKPAVVAIALPVPLFFDFET